MDLLPQPEQDEIVSATASFLAAKLPIERIRELIAVDDPVDPAVWSETANLGWFALGLPESLGGVGLGLADEALVLREVGRSLAPGPILSTMLGARVAAHAGLDDLSGSLLGGDGRVALGLLDATARCDRGGLSGRLRVLDGMGADQVLIAGADGAGLAAIADLDGLSDEVCLDEASRLAVADVVDATPIAWVDATVDPVWRRGLVLTAAQLVGIAEACRDVSVEHARERVQFDRPIGVNQAVKHPIADMGVRCEVAWPQVVVAALATDEADASADFQALSARVVALDAAYANAKATIQVLGGMGYTYEHDANLYVKRAKVLSRTFGGSSMHLGALLGQPAPA